MSKPQGIPETEWGEIAAPQAVAVLPITVVDLSKLFEANYFEYDDDGLGRAISCVIQIEQYKYWITSHLDSQEHSGHSSVYVRSFELNSSTALDTLLEHLPFDRSELPWISDRIGEAKWILSRLDDNGNEVEMFRFQEEFCAKGVQKRFTEKGHKQTYFVRRL